MCCLIFVKGEREKLMDMLFYWTQQCSPIYLCQKQVQKLVGLKSKTEILAKTQS